MANMIVSGLTDYIGDEMNGTYVETGVYAGKPYYQYIYFEMIYSYMFYLADKGWVLTEEFAEIDDLETWVMNRGGEYGVFDDYAFYRSPDNVATPDLATWEAGTLGEDFGLPTVTAEGGGEPEQSIIPLAMAHYRRLRSN